MTGALHKKIFGPNYRWWALCIVALAVFIATTDAGLLNISLPVIMSDFNADLALAGWISFIYALVTGSLYLPCGWLSDLVGRKKTFSAGFLLYSLGSFVAGSSQGPGQLIFCRALQAVGSALMMVNTFALVTSLFPVEQRGRAMGISGGTVSAFGFTVGPILGGLITHTLGWRSVFYVTSFLGLVGFVATRLILLEEEKVRPGPQRKRPFDFIGTVVFALGLTSFLLALTTGQKGLWNSSRVRGEFLIAFLSLGLFIWWEGRTRYPLLDLKLFRIRPFVTGNLARLASFVGISMNNLIMPFYLQLGLALDPLRAGLLMTPTALALAVLSPITGWLSDRVNPRLLSSAGLAVKGIALMNLTSLDLGATPFEIVTRLTLLGIGLGLFQTPNNNSLMSSIPQNRLGVGSSFLSMVRSFGQSVGAALATTIVSTSLLAVSGQTSLRSLEDAGLQEDSLILSAFMQGYRYVYLTAGFVCLAGAVASAMPDWRGKRKAAP